MSQSLHLVQSKVSSLSLSTAHGTPLDISMYISSQLVSRRRSGSLDAGVLLLRAFFHHSRCHLQLVRPLNFQISSLRYTDWFIHRGVFQAALFKEGLAPASTLSYIGSTQAAVEAIIAIPVSRLVATYGPRRIATIGAVLTGLGPIIAGSVTHSVAGLMLTEVSLHSSIGQIDTD